MGWKILEVTLKVVVKVFGLTVKTFEMLTKAFEWLITIIKEKEE